MKANPAAAPSAAVPLEQRDSVKTVLDLVGTEFPTFVLFGIHRDSTQAAPLALIAGDKVTRVTGGAMLGLLLQAFGQVAAMHGLGVATFPLQAMAGAGSESRGVVLAPSSALPPGPARRRRFE